MAASQDFDPDDLGSEDPPLSNGSLPPEAELASENDEFNEDDFDDDFDDDFEDELDEDLKEFEAELDGSVLGERAESVGGDDEFEEEDF